LNFNAENLLQSANRSQRNKYLTNSSSEIFRFCMTSQLQSVQISNSIASSSSEESSYFSEEDGQSIQRDKSKKKKRKREKT
jgi:hypothetical protein